MAYTRFVYCLTSSSQAPCSPLKQRSTRIVSASKRCAVPMAAPAQLQGAPAAFELNESLGFNETEATAADIIGFLNGFSGDRSSTGSRGPERVHPDKRYGGLRSSIERALLRSGGGSGRQRGPKAALALPRCGN